jgi:hypothetical protein
MTTFDEESIELWAGGRAHYLREAWSAEEDVDEAILAPLDPLHTWREREARWLARPTNDRMLVYFASGMVAEWCAHFATLALASCRGMTKEYKSSALEIAIQNSEWVLSLTQNWDHEDSPPVNRLAWERAVSFLRKQANLARELYGSELAAPRILPGPNAGIDLLWREARYEALVHIPAKDITVAEFYADDREAMYIKGTLDLRTTNVGLLQWLSTNSTGL